MNLKSFLSVLVLFLSLRAHADVVPTDEVTKAGAEIEGSAVEASPSSPPLETDDVGTPGPYGLELNLIGASASDKLRRTNSLTFDLNLGLGEAIQFRLSKGFLNERPENAAFENYWSGSSFGVKWRFYEVGSLKLAFYPSYLFSDQTKVQGVDPEGKSIYLPILISKDLGKYAVLINLGYLSNLDYPSADSFITSVALGRAISDTFRLMAEVRGEASGRKFQPGYGVGAVKELTHSEESWLETALFASVGQTFAEEINGGTETKILAGISFGKKPRVEVPATSELSDPR